MFSVYIISVIFALIITYCQCDTIANCTYESIEGTWLFKVGSAGQDGKDLCGDQFQVAGHTKITLQYPDIAVDQYDNKGFWTIIYNQGFEVVVHGRKYFAFSQYDNKTFSCSETMPGWSHNVLGKDWACFVGQQMESKHSRLQQEHVSRGKYNMYQHLVDDVDEQSVDKINSIQKLWSATTYQEHSHLTVAEKINMAGGRASRIIGKPKPVPVTDEARKFASFLPSQFDWRNIKGRDYVSPVRNQGTCGSCYAFSSVGMTESRIRILTNNTLQPELSTQDIVDCSQYSQGCDGGFPYLIAGKYAEDFGLVDETCNPYRGNDSKVCHTRKTCARRYSTRYQYVGGYYGGCNEELMKLALYKDGPLSVSFEVLSDFFQYKGGIYKHTNQPTSNLMIHFNPFELTNHAVLLVGWGESNGTPFWTVKNSWGTKWGESGYFRIIRGEDECGIESLAVEAFPIF